MSENWNWKHSLRSKEMLREYSEKKEFLMATGPGGWATDAELEKYTATDAELVKTIVLKYRPTDFEPKYIYWFQINPGVTKQIKTSEEKTIGVKKTNSTSVIDEATAAIGFPIDLIAIKGEASRSKTTLDAVQREVTATYSKSVTDTYENKTDSPKVFYHLYGIITYADGMKINYNTGYQIVSIFSIYGVQCELEKPKQSAREAWDSLMEE